MAEAIESATKKLVDKRDITVPEVHRTGNYKVQVGCTLRWWLKSIW